VLHAAWDLRERDEGDKQRGETGEHGPDIAPVPFHAGQDGRALRHSRPTGVSRYVSPKITCGVSYGCAMDDEDGKHLAEILRVLSKADAWAKRVNAAAAPPPGPAPHSSLRGDDDQAHPYEVSHAVWLLLGGAVDHLCCLRALL